MDAQAALDELSLLSTQVVEAVIAADDEIVGRTTTDDRASELGRIGRELLAVADAVRSDDAEIERVEIALADGGVLVVRDGGGMIVGTTVPAATSGLVLYDLRAALRRSGAASAEQPPRPPSSTEDADA
jgi:hypothetical protein